MKLVYTASKELCHATEVECNRVMGETVDLNADTGLPDWVQLTPKATAKGFAARDGRRFVIDDLKALVDELNASGEHIPIDVDHASEMPSMFEAPNTAAAGWLTRFAIRNRSEMWAAAEWTSGAALVKNRTYRSVSPAFNVTRESAQAFYEAEDRAKAPPMRVVGLSSMALTNKPALIVRSLNSEESIMDQVAICKLLGLPINTPAEEIMAALAASHKTAADVVPRADIEALHAKVRAMEAAEHAREAAASAARDAAQVEAIEAALASAQASGRVAPAGAAYHRSVCMRGDYAMRAQTLADFSAYVASQPSLVSNTQMQQAEVLHAGTPPGNAPTSVIANSLGVSPEAMEKTRQEIRSKPDLYPPRAYGV